MVNIKINNIITFINDDRKKSIFFFKNQSLLFIEAGNTNMVVITILFNCQTTLFLCFDNFLPFFFSSHYQKRCTSLLSTSLLYWIHPLFIWHLLFSLPFHIVFGEYKNYNIVYGVSTFYIVVLKILYFYPLFYLALTLDHPYLNLD